MSFPEKWRNLAADPQYADTKAELAKTMPATNHEDIGGKGGAEEGSGGDAKKAKKKEKKAKAKAAAK